MDKNAARVRDLFVWESLSKPTLVYPKKTFITLGGLLAIISIILVLFQEWLAITVTWAAYFLFFALTKTPQVTVAHKITTEGINSMDHSYLWQELGPFWFTLRNQETILHIAHRGLFGNLIVLVKSDDKEKVRDILAEYLPYIELPGKSSGDKFSEWLSKRPG